MRNTQVLLPQKDDGLPLDNDELSGVLSLKLFDELHEIAMTVLAKVLGAKARQLILGLDVVGANLALLYQLLHEKVPQRDVLCARTIGQVWLPATCSADMLSMYSSTLPKLL